MRARRLGLSAAICSALLWPLKAGVVWLNDPCATGRLPDIDLTRRAISKMVNRALSLIAAGFAHLPPPRGPLFKISNFVVPLSSHHAKSEDPLQMHTPLTIGGGAPVNYVTYFLCGKPGWVVERVFLRKEPNGTIDVFKLKCDGVGMVGRI
jgi:hypothetical protein